MSYKITTLNGEILTRREVSKRTGTSFPRGMDETFDLSHWELAWARVMPVPLLGAFETATKKETAEQIDGEWVIGWTVANIDPVAQSAIVDKERERRIAQGSTFSVQGVADPVPVPGAQPYREIIQAKLSAAQLFKAQGATDPIMKFRDGANTIHMFTPDQMMSLCLQSMQWYESVMAASWALKDAEGGIPSDYTADKYWPEYPVAAAALADGF